MIEPKSDCCGADSDGYIYSWGNNSKRATLKGRGCDVIAFGRRNSVLVMFENGQLEIVSRRALRHKPCKPVVKEEEDAII